MKNILSVKDIKKRYTTNHCDALRGVSFEVQQQEFFGLLGENGSGKTTLISIICGLLPATSGDVYINNQINPFRHPQIYQNIALVPQEIALYPTLTLYENLKFFAALYAITGNKCRQRIDAVTELVQLQNHCHQKIMTFSGGMKRRANLAISLLHEPKLILLDEPTVHVDPVSRQVIFAGLKHLNEQGATIIYTTHYMEEVEQLCSKLILLHKGNIIAEDQPQTLIQNTPGCKNLTDVFLKLIKEE